MDPIISTRASHLIIHRLEFHLSQLGVSVGLLHEFVAFTKRYTALTRVRKGEDIRLLITKKQWDKLDYLSDLSKNAIIVNFSRDTQTNRDHLSGGMLILWRNRSVCRLLVQVLCTSLAY